jgi:hypothetical protein
VRCLAGNALSRSRVGPPLSAPSNSAVKRLEWVGNPFASCRMRHLVPLKDGPDSTLPAVGACTGKFPLPGQTPAAWVSEWVGRGARSPDASGQGTVMVALSGLAPPVQLISTGVSV